MCLLAVKRDSRGITKVINRLWKNFMAIHPRSRPFCESQKKVIMPSAESCHQCGWKATKFWERLTRGSTVCVHARQGQMDRQWERKQTKSQSQILLCICSLFAHKQCPCCLLFFLIRWLALRGDATPPDYSVYSCCDALFIIFSAALLDWHSSLEHFTTALYSWSSHYPLNTRYAKSSDG